MRGKTVVITGATSGIGEVTALRLAQQGARILLTARDQARGDDMLGNLRAVAPGVAHGVFYADLSRLAEMKRVARELASATARIDVLINNAGAVFPKRQFTEDGLEATFATNHLAYFVLTALLVPRLTTGGSARIVNVSSGVHTMDKLDLDDLQWQRRRYVGFHAYSQSKSCNILFTRELARRLEGTGVTANALRPGFVRTRLFRRSGILMWLPLLWAISPGEGAATTVYLATSPEVASVSGQFFYKCRLATPAPHACSDENARRLWQISEELSGLGV